MRGQRALRRILRSFAAIAALGGLAATQTGCLEVAIILALDDSDEPDEVVDDGWVEPPAPSPPTVTVLVADWPPIGPSGSLIVQAYAENGIDSATLFFRNEVTLWGDGQTGTLFQPTGLELGEGLGELQVTVSSLDGSRTTRYVEDLLVDLSDPVAVLGPTTLPARDAAFEFWMGDAWIVSSARLEFGDVVLEEVLPEGYPDTLGVAWDYSLVRFDVEILPPVTGLAVLTITDAAGNETVETFTLSIDGAPPVASFVTPAADEVVSGAFEVIVDAYDSLPGPLVIELSGGGSLLATGTGPRATFVLDAEELGEGPLALEAVAIDEAGNRSAPVTVSVLVEHLPEEPPPAP